MSFRNLISNTDADWERYGATDPYYGVLTSDLYRRANLTEPVKSDFFKTGEAYIDDRFRVIRQHVWPGFAPESALDFGCGVGRLIIPLAQRVKRVVGLDISPSMLAEAKQNCEQRGLTHVRLLKSDGDQLSILNGQEPFDFINSFVVFQHVPIKRGLILFQRLLDHLKPGGVAALHFTYGKRVGDHIQRVTGRDVLRTWVPFLKNFVSLIREKDFFAPGMEMNAYPLHQLFYELQQRKIERLQAEYTDHGDYLGVILHFQKPAY